MITNNNDLLALRIKHREAVVAQQVFAQSIPPSFVCSEEEVDVGVERLRNMAAQLRPEFIPIVEADIGDDPNLPIAVLCWLALPFSFGSCDSLCVSQVRRRQSEVGGLL